MARWVLLVTAYQTLWLSAATLALLVGAAALLWRQRQKLLHARQSLQQSEARLALASEASGLGLWTWHVPADIIWLSPGFRAILGLDAETRFGYEAFFQLVHPEDRAAMRQGFAAVTAKQPTFEIEARFVGSDGSTRTLLSRGRGSFSRPDAPYFDRLVGASLDVSQQRHAETEHRRQRDELAHLSRVATLGELTGTLAHEINQPLAAILTNAQAGRLLVDHPMPDLPELRLILDEIIEDDLRATGIIRRIRTLLKKAPPEFRPVVVAELVHETLELLRPDFGKRGVTAHATCAPATPRIAADPVQIQQILINLLINAADALREQAPLDRIIAVRVRPGATGFVSIRVEDRGPGIPPERVSLLFKPFQSTKPDGLGIGLSLCRSIAEAHGGSLTLANRENGQGAVATLHLPIA